MKDIKTTSKSKKNSSKNFIIFAASTTIMTSLLCAYLYDKTRDLNAVPQTQEIAAEQSFNEAEVQMPSTETVENTDNSIETESENNDTVKTFEVSTESNDDISEKYNSDYISKETESEETDNEISISDDSDYTIQIYDSQKTLYTSDRVNLRSGAGTEYDKVSTVSKGSMVTVTGETTNGWDQVLVDGNTGYIKADYLCDKVLATSYVFAGDSRTVQMNQAVGKSAATWVAQVGEGYDYFVNTAIPVIDASASDGTAIIINYGVNDLYNVDKYIEKINSKIDSWIDAGATVYYAAVLPVEDYPTITNSEIENFNAKLKSELDSRIGWIDGYTYLQTTGFETADGLHFDADTYRKLYSYYTGTATV